jgi:2-keto-4-pentenoate hydratase/2-oxohepta-3-ene-1,7-dioic acid hydratase in catechol pathway
LIRFQGEDGEIKYGQQVEAGVYHKAFPVEGNIFGEDNKVMKKAVKVTKLLAPIKSPPAIFCIGINYKSHAKETNRQYPAYPVVFTKPTTSIQNPFDPIRIPSWNANIHVPQIDFEAELAIVVGKKCVNIKTVEEAEKVILGYTIANDITDRNWQHSSKGGGQFCYSKGFDTFLPIGPVLVRHSELTRTKKIADLPISLKLNGELMQNSNTSDMVFSVFDLLIHLSKDTTLQPGTVILTGTPSGVGVARKPQIFLKDGDKVEAFIEGIGTLRNLVEQGR